VPEEVGFKTKPEIALEQITAACKAGLPRGVVLMDAGYGNNSELRTSVTALGLTYVAGILSNTTVWAPGTGPLPPKLAWPRAVDQAPAPRWRASAGQGQGSRLKPSGQGLADDHLARGNQCAAAIALCAPARSHRKARF
jgi:SRSO17 transposase